MTDRQLEDQLNDYWDDLVRGAASPSTELLRPDLAATVQLAHNLDRTSAPNAAFAESLGQKLAAQASAGRRRLPRPFQLPGRLLAPAGLVGLALLGVVAFALYLWAAPSETVSAAQIVEKARAVADNPSVAGIASFEMTQVITGTPAAGIETRGQTHIWHKAPNKWRFETEADDGPQIAVSDGKTIWSYFAAKNLVNISVGGLSGPGAIEIPGRGTCALTTEEEEEVAGRAAYVVATQPDCKPLTLWVDKETFFILKSIVRSPEDGRVLQVMEVTSMRYNLELDDSLFAFTPPPGAAIQDLRPTPPEGQTPTPIATETVTITGTVADVALSARVIFLAQPVDGFQAVALTEETRVVSPNGGKAALQDMRPGMRIEASGRPGENGALLAGVVRILASSP